MAKKAKEEKVEEVEQVEAVEAAAPQAREAKVVEQAQPAQPAEGEIIFLNPHDVYREAQTGKVVQNEDGLHLVLEGQDGKKYVLPYVQDLHKDLKVGDEFKF